MQALATRPQPWAQTAPPPQPVAMQRMGTRCWKALVTTGVPSGDARVLAIAISHFIYLGHPPSPHQKELLGRYYQHVCAANIPALQLA